MRNGPSIDDTVDYVATNHILERDGSFWRCRVCHDVSIPFPSPMPDTADLGECTPRPWMREGEEPYVPRQRTSLDYGCPKCQAPAGHRCMSLYNPRHELTEAHLERRALLHG